MATAQDLYVEDPWNPSPGNNAAKPKEQQFFEAYSQAARSGTLLQGSMTRWYSSHMNFRSETGKVFHGADEMRAWLVDLFSSFEKMNRVPEYYVQYNVGGTVRVHVGLRRQLWMKGNHGEHPDTDTPMAWVCTIGPADDADGFLGLQFKEVSLYWDKTKTVQLLERKLPSD